MKEVKLNKVTEQELSVLQSELHRYNTVISTNFKQPEFAGQFFDLIMLIDITFRLWYSFHLKITKGSPAKGFSISLKPFEAVALLKCCMNRVENDARDTFTYHVKEKYKRIIDQQLKSL